MLLNKMCTTKGIRGLILNLPEWLYGSPTKVCLNIYPHTFCQLISIFPHLDHRPSGWRCFFGKSLKVLPRTVVCAVTGVWVSRWRWRSCDLFVMFVKRKPHEISEQNPPLTLLRWVFQFKVVWIKKMFCVIIVRINSATSCSHPNNTSPKSSDGK